MGSRLRPPSSLMADYGRLLSANASIKRKLRAILPPADRLQLEEAMAANRAEMSRLMTLCHAAKRAPSPTPRRRSRATAEEE